ncbi:MAG: helix-turn-helix domain-containing protein, partial [Actinomycetota bacterium]|nr:helix-turn-helix domain-containing protein [Actinomycetota bacterium]
MSAVIKRYGGKPHLKLTLLILADRASDDGFCWPSYDELAGKLGCSRRSAINNVNDLIAADLLKIVAKGGRFTDPQTKKHRGFSNRFVINVSAIEALPLLYQPRRSYPQGVVDGCSALQN